MTRREAIAIAFGLPLLAADPKEFWNQKTPQNWSKQERSELLAHSPWARDADAKFNGGPGMLGGPLGSIMAQPGAMITGPVGSGPAKSPGRFAPVVRWESALPVRLAEGDKSTAAPAQYILSITGDLPGISRNTDETDDEYQSRLENFKEYTRLEKRGGAIYLVKIGYQPGQATDSGLRFYFERTDPITLRDGSVTFVTRLGPIDLKCKFSLKEMVYQGKLEL